MLELIFVIVILGIVASIGSAIITQVYESYIVQRAQYRATTKTELALQQIANRLRYAIPGTVVSRLNKTGTTTAITEIGASNANDKVLQWVAYDGDSFEAISSSTFTGAARRPGWSGFCDIDASSSTELKTPGSNLSLADTIIGNLSGDTKTLSDTKVFFPHSTAAYSVSKKDDDTFNISLPPGTTIYERYKLAWSSYALEVDENGDLILHYNFTPDIGYPIDGNSSILLHHVTNFRFKGSEGSLRIKICKWERIGEDANITACKEKVIF